MFRMWSHRVDMNVKKFKELIEKTEFVGCTDDYLIHKFIDGGNYLIIDTYGDFLILERDKIESVFSTIWDDLYGPITEEVPHILN